jgi:phosphotransferase system enzyme I (PtsP)
MPDRSETESRKLLRRLRDTLAERGQGQEWLDRITHLISDCIGTEVCFNCLFRDPETPQLCATEGLVGRVARTA